MTRKNNKQTDPSESFLVKKTLVAVRKTRLPGAKRLPITDDILHRLLSSLHRAVGSSYQRCMYRSMFLLAFHAFLRVGEITHSVHNLQVNSVRFLGSRVQIMFQSFKHSEGQAETRFINSNSRQPDCPIQALKDYIAVRGNTPGPLYTVHGSAVTRRTFVQVLKDTLTHAGIPSHGFNSHSFRIGAATTYAKNGASDAQIRFLGRWKSDAFKVYIRSPQS
ncbi:hypothetical protein BaRGS_00004366 [Batillaria attramentaria]|uniref:Tyr recombinase domain-containing protein n=1 Tax=Batillaria attramentaria TaxID=370345 RepID=A0ABD0LXX5_9CAEN